MCAGLDSSPLLPFPVLGLLKVLQYLCGLSITSQSMQSRHLLMQKHFPLKTQGKLLLQELVVSCRRLVPGVHVGFSFAWLYAEVSRRSLPASLNISSVGIQDLPRVWAAAQNVNSGGSKRLLAELSMKINLEESAPFEEIKGG